MKFRAKDLRNYFVSKNINWPQVAEVLTLKSCETTWNGKELEAEIMPNLYPSLASLVGLAKEIAVVTGYKLKEPKWKVKESQNKITQTVVVDIKTPKCNYYVARVVLGVKNKKSPSWLQNFVKAYGFSSINFLVDLSNFVMIEYGAPLHIFDLDKIDSVKQGRWQIIMREAKAGETFHSLSDQYFLLPAGAVVMADRNKIIDLVGIQGGSNVKVDLTTKNILVQAPIIQSDIIYEVSRALNFKTDASSRFEKNVAPINASVGLERLTSLIQHYLGGKVLQGRLEKGTVESRRVVLTRKRLDNIWGDHINKKEIEKYLGKSKIKLIKKTKDGYYLELPSERLDLSTEEEVIEEIIRLHGLAKLKLHSKLPISTRLGRETEQLEFIDLLKQIATSAGFDEILSYSFTTQAEAALFADFLHNFFPADYQLLKVLNPLSSLYEVYRPLIVPGLVRACVVNQKFSREQRLFEVGHIGILRQCQPIEAPHFGAVISLPDPREALLEMKGFLWSLLEKVGASDVHFKDTTLDTFEVSAVFHEHKEKIIGCVGLPDKSINAYYDLDQRVVVAEIDLEKLIKSLRQEMEFEPLPVFPAILRDLSFIVAETTSIDFIEKSIQDLGGELLEDVEIIDIYQGEGIPDDQKVITLRFIFRAKNRSLKDEEVNQLMQRITKDLVHNFKASVR